MARKSTHHVIKLYDDREAMTLPLVSLSKTPRSDTIHWTSKDGLKQLTVVATQEYGMATIWDYDIVLWLLSVVKQRHLKTGEISPIVEFTDYELLKGLGRKVGGDQYKRLWEAMRRLTTTTIETNVRDPDKRRRERNIGRMIEHVSAQDHLQSEMPSTMKVKLSDWFLYAFQEAELLSVSTSYFDIKKSTGKVIYRLLRKMVGKNPKGWRIDFDTIYSISGSTDVPKKFYYELREIIKANDLPDYLMSQMKGVNGQPQVLAIPRPTGDESVDILVDNSVDRNVD